MAAGTDPGSSSMSRSLLAVLFLAAFLAAAPGGCLGQIIDNRPVPTSSVPAAPGGCIDDYKSGWNWWFDYQFYDHGCTGDHPFCYGEDPVGPDRADTGEGAGPYDHCAVCLDSHAKGRRDWGCYRGFPHYNRPICYEYHAGGTPFFNDNLAYNGASDADREEGVACVRCIDSHAGRQRDAGCWDDLYPICYEQHIADGVAGNPAGMDPSDGDNRYGITCVACIDTASGTEPDLGCKDAYGLDLMNGLINRDTPSPICYTGSASTGSLMEGEAVHFGPSMYNGWEEGYNASCTFCLDSHTGTNADLGCPGDRPYCADVRFEGMGGDFMNGREMFDKNDGDNGFGAWCSECFDTSFEGVDTGCSTGKPHCLGLYPPEGEGGTNFVGFTCNECIPFYGSLTEEEASFGCTTEKPLCLPTDLSQNNLFSYDWQCFVCQDTFNHGYWGTADRFHEGVFERGTVEPQVDDGCNLEFPFCTGPIFGTGSEGEAYVVGGSLCSECQDDLIQENLTNTFDPNDLDLSDVDFMCNRTHPFCYDQNTDPASYGYGFCSAVENPVCVYAPGSDGYLATIPAGCLTDLNVYFRLVVELTGCYKLVAQPFLETVAAGMKSSVSFMPDCSYGFFFNPYEGGRRHMLQLLTPQQFLFEARIYVENIAQGQSVLDIINSPSFRVFLQGVIGPFATLADVVDLQAVFLLLAQGTSDPHFTTLAGDKFDFNGVAGNNYCIVTDKEVQINAHVIGATEGNRLSGTSQPDARTWMDQVAIMHGSDRILINANVTGDSTYTTSLGSVMINGEALSGRTAMKKLPSGITISRQKTRITVVVPGVVAVGVEVVRASFWEAGAGPGSNFLNLQVKQFNATSAVHGVLGQSFAPNAKVPSPEDNAADYATTGIFAADCLYNQFTQ